MSIPAFKLIRRHQHPALWLSRVIASVVLASAGWAQVTERPIPDDPVAIDSGRVAGKLLASGVRAYLGVPYAAPPVRELRWREPQPVKPWLGVYHADRFAPESFQFLRGHETDRYFGEEAASEDCLYLNVWAPSAAPVGGGHPVIMWIHGGGFINGSPDTPRTSGEYLARKGVILVAITYRVGVLGMLSLPELTAESPHHASGNYGYLDQVAALRWIHRNIGRFGGDPGNVTIMGQSAGAISAFNLQASPLARGLFHKIIGLSCGGFRVGQHYRSRAEGEQIGLRFQRALGVKSLAEMRDIPADRILAVQKEFTLPAAVRVDFVIDGYFLASTPREIFQAGEQADVPLLIGFTRDESWNDLRTVRTLGEYRAVAKNYFGDRAPEFLNLYPASTDGEARLMGPTAARDGGQATSMRNWALFQAKPERAPVYLYMFSRVHPVASGVKISDFDPKVNGAQHGGDVTYFFQTLDAYNSIRHTRDWSAYDRALSERMSDTIVAFAKTGNPGTASVPFPRYDPGSERLLEFGDHIRAISLNAARMDFVGAFPLPVDYR